MMMIAMCATSISVNAMTKDGNVATLSTVEVEGIYSGRLSKVYMNGDKSPVENIETTVSENSDGTFNLHIDAFKVGKMPGTIKVDAQNVKIPTDGTSFSQNCTKAVNLTILGFIPANYDALIEGSLVNGKLTYTLTVNAEYSNAPFTAIVTFTGDWTSEL